ncbi:MAG: hypothetical protein K6G73_12310 [Marinilabiliaceae bacterium]|nr:hypothetical protein [Marinilabiliaceae bacterium]
MKKEKLPENVMVHWLIGKKEFLEYRNREYLDDDQFSSFNAYGIKTTATDLFLTGEKLTQKLAVGKLRSEVTIWVTKPTKDEEKIYKKFQKISDEWCNLGDMVDEYNPHLNTVLGECDKSLADCNVFDAADLFNPFAGISHLVGCLGH